MAAAPILEVESLNVAIPVPAGTLHPVQEVGFRVTRGHTLAIVGESGCGKSLTSLALMNLLPPRAARTAGRLALDGQDLLGLSEREMADIRGNRMSMIFQEPMTSLNPAYTVGDQLVEAERRHRRTSVTAARDRAVWLLEKVGMTGAGERFAAVPAPALRRAPAARDDRDGADVRSRPHHRGRADHRARRHHPGADSPPPRRPAAGVRDGFDPDYPRPRGGRPALRPGGGHVCRPDRRRGGPLARSSGPLPTRTPEGSSTASRSPGRPAAERTSARFRASCRRSSAVCRAVTSPTAAPTRAGLAGPDRSRSVTAPGPGHRYRCVLSLPSGPARPDPAP